MSHTLWRQLPILIYCLVGVDTTRQRDGAHGVTGAGVLVIYLITHGSPIRSMIYFRLHGRYSSHVQAAVHALVNPADLIIHMLVSRLRDVRHPHGHVSRPAKSMVQHLGAV